MMRHAMLLPPLPLSLFFFFFSLMPARYARQAARARYMRMARLRCAKTYGAARYEQAIRCAMLYSATPYARCF